VSILEGALFAKQHGLLYVETSAKEGWGVVDAFEWTAREVLDRVSKAEMERRKVSNSVWSMVSARVSRMASVSKVIDGLGLTVLA
jgi:hypothetical protein